IYNMGLKFSDVLDVSGNYRKQDAEFRALRQRTGSNIDAESWQGNASVSDLSRVVPLLGLSVPVGYTYSWDRSLPKFFSQSDTRNTEERKQNQRTERIHTGYNFSVIKKPSVFWLNQITIDRLRFAYNESHDAQRSYTSRDTSTSRQQSLKYEITPPDRTLPLIGRMRLSYLPRSAVFQVAASTTNSSAFNVLHLGAVDSLVRRPTSKQRTMNVSASTALRPIPPLDVRYTY